VSFLNISVIRVLFPRSIKSTKMKFITYMICVAMLLTACHRGQSHDHGHAPDDHDHEGHNHEPAVSAGNSEHDPGEIVILPEQAEAAGVQVEAVWPKPFDMVIKTGGQIQAAQGDELTVVAPSGGIVSFARSLTEGSAVRQGEVLVTVSSRNMLEGDPAAKAQLAYGQAEREYRRAASLAKDSLIPAKEYEQARTGYETAKVAYDALAESHTANGITVSAGIGGYVKSRPVAEGEYVTAGQPLVTVAQNRRLQLRCDVPERYYSLLATITTASFRTPYDDALYRLADLKGRLVSYGRSAHAASFCIPVTFEFDNTGNITPGAFVEAYLACRPAGNVLAVPLKAMIEEQGLYFVYVQTGEDGYLKREVKPGDDNGLDVHILAGLKPGDKVVTQGAVHVKLAGNAPSIPEHSHSH
jgi:RND family efflux transporter MFP subunit